MKRILLILILLCFTGCASRPNYTFIRGTVQGVRDNLPVAGAALDGFERDLEISEETSTLLRITGQEVYLAFDDAIRADDETENENESIDIMMRAISSSITPLGRLIELIPETESNWRMVFTTARLSLMMILSNWNYINQQETLTSPQPF